MNVTIRNMDEAAFRTLKARAALEGLTLGEAVSEAVRLWVGARRSKLGEPPTKPGSTAAEGASTSPESETTNTEADDWSEFHRTYDRIRAELRAKRAARPLPDYSKKTGRKLAIALAKLRTGGGEGERLSEQIDEILYGS